jgi:hypothetical protein
MSLAHMWAREQRKRQQTSGQSRVRGYVLGWTPPRDRRLLVHPPLAPTPGFLVRSTPTLHQAGATRGRLHVDEFAHGGCPGIGGAARAPHRSGGQRGVAPQIDGADGPTLATEVLRLMPHRLPGQALRRHNSPRVHGTGPLPSGNARTSRRSLNVSRPAADTPIPVPDQ